MDISYLLALQNLRETTGNVLTPFMLLVSNLLPVLLAIPVAIYWCCGKDDGRFILLNYAGSGLVNNTIKCTACCYRPWIRDVRVKPVEGALKGATGYSFPSGHVQTTTAVLGTAGCLFWKKRRWLSVISFIFILLMAFSRNYLGVHTPQDVLVAMLETAGIILINSRLMPKIMNGSRQVQNRAILIGIVITVAAIVSTTVKSYPTDYVDGVLLVDPYEMMTDTYGAAGDFLGFLIGLYVERVFIRFRTTGSGKEKLLRLIIGIIPFGILYLVAIPGLCTILGSHFGTLLGRTLVSFYVMAVWPAVFMHFHKTKSEV